MTDSAIEQKALAWATAVLAEITDGPRSQLILEILIEDEVSDAAAAEALDELIELGRFDEQHRQIAEELLRDGGFGRSTGAVREILADN